VLARIETPISRARPEELLLGDALVVVQPGNSLWRIARRAYGGGVYYTEIYGANRAQILDPNMIFPGQILALPVLN
jgi:nucleoid-associated protein YgaU